MSSSSIERVCPSAAGSSKTESSSRQPMSSLESDHAVSAWYAVRGSPCIIEARCSVFCISGLSSALPIMPWISSGIGTEFSSFRSSASKSARSAARRMCESGGARYSLP